MPNLRTLTGCPLGNNNDGIHCYCGFDGMCCYCRLPREEAITQQISLDPYQQPTLGHQNRGVYYTPTTRNSAGWFIDEPQQVTVPITWTPIADGLAASDTILENLIFSPITDDDGSEEIKD